MQAHESSAVPCFADDCPATSPVNEHGWPVAGGWSAQANQARFACPEHTPTLRRALGLSDSQAVDA